jgi:hypothetical protein
MFIIDQKRRQNMSSPHQDSQLFTSVHTYIEIN